ncbi:MAG: hypothetical protein PHN69_05985 [Candidatus Pacebacteria bacterium]|nr:hypothetical protein [Candidatus Paceibacterota bacterium]
MDAEQATRHIMVTPAIGITIKSLTLINGYADYGGSIYLNNAYSLFLDDLRLLDNRATNNAGVVYVRSNSQAEITINACLISGNTAEAQGGVLSGYNWVFPGAHVFVNKSIIRDNSSTGSGGVFSNIIDLSILDSEILNNYSYSEGHVFWCVYKITANNTQFIGNRGASYSGLQRGGKGYYKDSSFYDNFSLVDLAVQVTYDSCVIKGADFSNRAQFGNVSFINSFVQKKNYNADIFEMLNIYMLNTTVINTGNYAIYDDSFEGDSPSVSFRADNSILIGNFNAGSNSYFTACTVNNSIFTDKTLPEQYWNANNIVTGAVTENLFVDYENGDYRLWFGSQAVNFGSNDLWNANSNNITLDYSSNPRIIDSSIDVGCYEFQGLTTLRPEFYLYDLRTDSRTYMTQQEVGISLSGDNIATHWYLSESSASPAADDLGWALERPVTYRFVNKLNENKLIHLWTKDEYSRVIKASSDASIEGVSLDTIAPHITLVSFEAKPYINANNTVNITFSYNEVLVVTPEISLINYGRATVDFVTLIKNNSSSYTAEFVVTVGVTDGAYVIHSTATDNALFVGTGNVDISVIIVDRAANLPREFKLVDLDDGSSLETDDRIVGVSFSSDLDHAAWIIGEGLTYANKPLIDSELWSLNRPREYMFKDFSYGNKTVYFWAKDKAGNVSEVPVVAGIEYKPKGYSTRNYLVVDIPQPHMPAGLFAITVNFDDLGVVTPDVWIVLSNNEKVFLNFHSVSSNQYLGTNFMATMNIPTNNSYDGQCKFELRATKSNGIELDYTGIAYVGIGGDRDFMIDTYIENPASLDLKDKDELNSDASYTNDFIVNVYLELNKDHSEWLIGEELSVRPYADDVRWTNVRPAEYMFSDMIRGDKLIYVWAKDRAGNISELPATKSILYMPERHDRAYVSVFPEQIYLTIGTYNVTINVLDEGSSTPDVWLYFDAIDTRITLDLVNKTVDTVNGAYFGTTIVIPSTNTLEGNAHFEVVVTNSSGAVIKFLSYNYKTMDGYPNVVIDTVITHSSFELFDGDTKRNDFTNDLSVRVSVSVDSDVIGWLLDETVIARPALHDVRWKSQVPYVYSFKSVKEELKTVYLWVKDRAGNVSSMSVSRSIIYDITTPTVDFYELWHRQISNNYLVTLSISEAIDNTPNLQFSINDDELIGSISLDTNEGKTWVGAISIGDVFVNTISWFVVVTDNAGNEQTQFNQTYDGSDRWPNRQGVLELEIANSYLNAGLHMASLNVSVDYVLINTPNIRLRHISTDIVMTLTVDSSYLDEKGAQYGFVINVPTGAVLDGQLNFEITVTSDSDFVLNVTSDDRVHFDTVINVPSLAFYDRTTRIEKFVKGINPYIEITSDSDVVGWFLSEQAITPQLLAPAWKIEVPTTYLLENDREEEKTIHLWVKDRAGNLSGTSASVVYDASAPSISSIQLFNKSTDKQINSIGDAYYLKVGTYNVTFNMGEALMTAPTIWLENGSVTEVVIELSRNALEVTRADNRTYTAEYVVTPGATEGTYNIYYSATDNAGNLAKSLKLKAKSLIVDVSNPTVNLGILDADTNSNLYTNSTNVRLSINVVEEYGVYGYFVTENFEFTLSEVEGLFTIHQPRTYTFSTLVAEAKSLKLLVLDNAGNVGSASVSILLDNIKPTATIELVSTSDNILEGLYGITLNVGAILSGLQTTPSLYFIPRRTSPILLTLHSSLFVGIYTSTLDITAYTGDGLGYFVFSATDNAGNVSYKVQLPIIHNQVVTQAVYVSTNIQLPFFEVFDINSLSTRDVNDQTVGVKITNDARATGWLIKEDAKNPEATDVLWSYTKISQFNLRTKVNGERTLYLWLKDDEGRVVTAPVIATINYDTISPEIVSVSLVQSFTGSRVDPIEGAYYLRVGTYNVTLNMNESLILTPTIWLENGLVTEVVIELSRNVLEVTRVTDRIYAAEYAVTSGTTEGSYSINYSATDNAGNLAKSLKLKAKSLIVDVSAPIVNLEILDADTNSNLYTNSTNVLLSINVVEEYGVYGYYATENLEFTISEVEGLFTIHQPITYNFSTLESEDKLLKLLVIDRAGNISSASYAITLDAQVPTATIDFPVTADNVDVGEYRITLNVGGIVSGLVSAPSLWFAPKGTLPLNLPLERETENQYSATLSVTTYTGDGLGYFLFSATDNAGNVAVSYQCPVNSVSEITMNVLINTTVKTPSFNAYDLELGESVDFTNDNIFIVKITEDEQAVAWMISEVYSTKPSASNTLWINSRPVEYKLLNKKNEMKTMYLWIQNANGYINDVPAIATINYDSVKPTLVSSKIARLLGDDVSYLDGYSYLRAGTYNITFNFSEELMVTPTIWLENVLASTNGGGVSFADGGGVVRVSSRTYTAEYVVTEGTVEGTYNVYYIATDNAGNVANNQVLTVNSFIVDVTVSDPLFVAYDKDTKNNFRTDDLMIVVNITNDADVVAWLMSETDKHAVSPSSNDPLWVNARPIDHRFKNLQSGLRTIHLWVKDKAGNINKNDTYTFMMFETSELEARSYANVYVDQGTLVLPGVMNITLNVIEQVILTPSLTLRLEDGSKIAVNLNFVSTSDRNGVFYKASIVVPEIASWSGEAYFEVVATRTNFTVFSATENRTIIGLVGGQSKINIAVPMYRVVTVNQKTTFMELGSKEVVVVSFNFGSDSSAVAIQKIKVTLRGDVYDHDISEIYFAYPVGGSYADLTARSKIKDKEVILNFNASHSYFRGTKDIVLMMSISEKAVLDSSFQVVIQTNDIIISSGQSISENNLPFQSEPIAIIKKTNRILVQPVLLPTLDIRLGQKDVVLFDISLLVNNEGTAFLSGFTLRKSAELPDEAITNVRLLRKNEVDTPHSLTRDQLMAEELSFVNGYMHINFTPFYNISDFMAMFYIMADIEYAAGGAREFSIGVISTSSFRVDNKSKVLQDNIDNLVNTFNVRAYIPTIIASADKALDDALFAETTKKRIIQLNIKTDHEATTVDMLKVDATLFGNNVLSVGVEDANKNILASQLLVNGTNSLVFNLPYVVTEQVRPLYVFIVVDNYTEEGFVSLSVTGNSLRVSSEKLNISPYDTGVINIKSTSHPRKVRLYSPKNFVNNYVSTKLVLLTATADLGKIEVFYKIDEALNGQQVLPWTEVKYLSVSSNVAPIMEVELNKLPLSHNVAYEFSLKAVKGALESDVYSWSLQSDFTKPRFVKNKIEVSQINYEGLLKHILYLGAVTDDVSDVDSIEIYNRTGNEPKWQLAKVVSGNNQRIEITELQQERTYFYKAIAKNTAGLSSLEISSDVGISTGFNAKSLTKLSNYPNPFNSNVIDTTIYYYLNQNMNITIKIYNIFGKKMYERNCFAGETGGSSGANELIWSGVDQSGNKLPMGSYPMVVYETDTKQILDQRVIGIIH